MKAILLDGSEVTIRGEEVKEISIASDDKSITIWMKKKGVYMARSFHADT